MILYFGVTTRGDLAILHEKGVRDVMISVGTVRGLKAVLSQAQEYGMDVMLDSGAFTASGEREITVEQYAKTLAEWQYVVERYVNLDVIGDPNTTAENQAFLETQGFHPIPVYHYGSPINILDELTQRYEMVGLGGMAHKARTHTRQIRRWVGDVTRRYPETRFHAFGMTPGAEMHECYSCDSSAWVVAARFQELILREGRADAKALLFNRCERMKHNIRALQWRAENMRPDATLFDMEKTS